MIIFNETTREIIFNGTRKMIRFLSVCLLTTFILNLPALAEQDQATRIGVVPQGRITNDTLIVKDEKIEIICKAKSMLLDGESKSWLTIENKRTIPYKITLEADRRISSLKINDSSLTLKMPTDSEGVLPATADAELRPGSSEIFVYIQKAYHLDASAQSADIFAPILVLRHPVCHEYPGNPADVKLSIKSVGKYRRWGRVDRTHVLLTLPDGWRWKPIGEKAPDNSNCGDTCHHAVIGKKIEWNWSRSSDDSTPFDKSIAVYPYPRTLFNGGPFVGVGGSYGKDWAARLRVGYDIGINSNWIFNLAGEYLQEGKEFIVVPSIDKALIPYKLFPPFVPALTAGIGIPYYVKPYSIFGVRGQVGLNWPIFSFIGTGIVFLIDYVPKQYQTEKFWKGSAMMQVGL